ncbi:hypothetical protein IX307_000851 [Bacteroides pyogenes]|nr:hypothetical protein [Bacteroides pyogenes]MBR8786542.1 hypothetical protein [Bacteroides pyogenes]MBR8792025.1 hypothetical protein [Bacteroides pyogenes]
MNNVVSNIEFIHVKRSNLFPSSDLLSMYPHKMSIGMQAKITVRNGLER